MTVAGPAEPIRGRGRPRPSGRDFLTVAEVAEGRGVSKYTIYWHIKQGHIRAVKQGRTWLVPRAAYEAQMAGAGPETLTGLLGLHREELEEIVAGAVSRALREMFGVLAQPPTEPEWAPWREPGGGRGGGRSHRGH